MKKIICFVSALILSLLAFLPLQVQAGQERLIRTEDAGEESDLYEWKNGKTGYKVKILLPSASEEELAPLIRVMQSVTGYCDAVVVMDYDSALDTEAGARAYASEMMGASGVLFYIDMNHHELYLCTKGAAKNTITDSLSRSITDNVYTMASRGDYAGCSEAVFEQVNRVFSGQRIAQPMKVITSVLFALITGLLLNFVIVTASRKKKKAEEIPYFESAPSSLAISEVETKLVSTTMKNNGSGGGGGAYIALFILEAILEGAAGSGGGGGGHGGGSSFGGGGHRF